MSEELIELNLKYNSRGMDGLNRFEKEKLLNYKKTEYLFDKFLAKRKNEATLQVTHENILNLGEDSLRKLDAIRNRNTSIEFEFNLKREIEKLQREVEEHKNNVKNEYQRKYESEKKSLKNSYESLMKRIEVQRDEAEEERVKEIIRKMSEECEIALKKQWAEAEELRRRTIQELREQIRKEAREEMERILQKAIQDALQKAEEEFKLREKEAIRLTREQCELEYKRLLKQVCQKYDAKIEKLESRINELEQELTEEKTRRQKLQNDFRLLQVDYKRFMNYTNHYNSDYMMKLRHIGSELIEDYEFESELDKKLHSSVSANLPFKTFDKNK